MIQTDTGPTKLTFDAFQKMKRRREAVLPVVVDDDAAKAFELAEAALRRAKLIGDDTEKAEAEKNYRDAEAELRAGTVIFRLRALPRRGEGSFDVLKAEHPPTDADHDEIRELRGEPKAKARWCRRTFEPALVAASLLEPHVTLEQATAWATEWNDGEWTALVAAALDVNQAPSSTGSLVFS